MGTRTSSQRVMVCNCERTMDIDGAKLASGLGLDEAPTIFAQLCRAQISSFEKALDGDRPVLVACTQEAPLFSEVAAEKGRESLDFVNIRERAGWCARPADAMPKMAALIAEAGHRSTPAGLTTLRSDGSCLVYGAGQQAMDTAARLADRLNVTLVLSDASDVIPPMQVNFPIHRGRVRKASGVLGAFRVMVDGYAPMVPASRDGLAFEAARDGVTVPADLVFDMSGDTPLFSDHDRRDGYFSVDPGHPAAVADAMFDASDLVGEFEKPLYVTYQPDKCAHSRSGQVGCTKCLDNCPTSAIRSDGDHVHIDPAICGGCGNCAALCPTSAVNYAFPGRQDLIARIQILISTYRDAGGREPVLLVHDENHGNEVISAMARFGDGLPVNVLPLATYAVTQLGHDTMTAALATGAGQVVVLAPPERAEEMAALEDQTQLTNALLSGLGYAGPRVHIVAERDPDAVAQALASLKTHDEMPAHAFSAVGDKRDIARLAIARLHEAAPEPAEVIALPDGAPYGRISIDTAGCTLCLSCVSACPAGAIHDNPDRPQVSFQEAACVQCGLCRQTCPERVITLEPRYNFTNAAMSPEVLHEEEPFECIRCGKPFGVKSSIERIVAQLEGKHSMFTNSSQSDLIKMCDDCRIKAVWLDGEHPMAMGERPRVRTTDDYRRAEAEAKKNGKSSDDFLS